MPASLDAGDGSVKQPVSVVVSLAAVQVDSIVVEVALQWCSDSFTDALMGFVNNVKTKDGGTHLDGLKAALTRTINNLARKSKALKEGEPNLSGDHVREGLTGLVHVKVGACSGCCSRTLKPLLRSHYGSKRWQLGCFLR